MVSRGPDDGLLAKVTFCSTQQPGYGPPERKAETCTDWDIAYVLSVAADGGYRIVRSTDLLSQP